MVIKKKKRQNRKVEKKLIKEAWWWRGCTFVSKNMYKKYTTEPSASLSTTFLKLRKACVLEISSSDLSSLILLTATRQLFLEDFLQETAGFTTDKLFQFCTQHWYQCNKRVFLTFYEFCFLISYLGYINILGMHTHKAVYQSPWKTNSRHEAESHLATKGHF